MAKRGPEAQLRRGKARRLPSDALHLATRDVPERRDCLPMRRSAERREAAATITASSIVTPCVSSSHRCSQRAAIRRDRSRLRSATSAVKSSASARLRPRISRAASSAATTLPTSIDRRKIVSGWPCDVDSGAPIRGRTGDGDEAAPRRVAKNEAAARYASHMSCGAEGRGGSSSAGATGAGLRPASRGWLGGLGIRFGVSDRRWVWFVREVGGAALAGFGGRSSGRGQAAVVWRVAAVPRWQWAWPAGWKEGWDVRSRASGCRFGMWTRRRCAELDGADVACRGTRACLPRWSVRIAAPVALRHPAGLPLSTAGLPGNGRESASGGRSLRAGRVAAKR